MAIPPLSTSLSTINVMNAALNELGVAPITSFLDNSLAARTGNAMFADVLEEAISAYPWRFARDFLTLQAVPTLPPPNWSGLYALPQQALVVHKVWADERVTKFDVFGRNVATPDKTDSGVAIRAEVTKSVDPSAWPGYFRRAFILHLAAAMAMPITQDERFADLLTRSAAQKFAFAKSRDAQGRSPAKVDTQAFIRARRSRVARY